MIAGGTVEEIVQVFFFFFFFLRRLIIHYLGMLSGYILELTLNGLRECCYNMSFCYFYKSPPPPLPPHLIHLDQGMDPFFAEKLENCILFKGDIHVPVYVKILKSEN